MNSSALIHWEVDVERETERLIEYGYPPWSAAEQAVKNVSRRRRERAQQESVKRAVIDKEVSQ